MLVARNRGWELRESEATPEAAFHRRRDLLKAVAAGSILAPGLLSSLARAGEEPSADLYPAKQNSRYVLDRPLTDEKLATSYNNFYEFGSQKSIASAAQALVVRPWTIKIDGLVEKEMTVEVEVAPNVKNTFQLSVATGASPSQEQILNMWLRKTLKE